MFCPKCGALVDDERRICPQCQLDFETIDTEEINSTIPANIPDNENKDKNNSKNNGFRTALMLLFFALAATVIILFFMAAGKIVDGGNEIMHIRSVGGRTLEEAYYHELGKIFKAFAMITRGTGIFFASVLVWMGIQTRKR